MNRKLVTLWLTALASEFIEGAADAFLVVSGGAAVANSGAVDLPALSPLQLLYSVLIGGAWYAAAYLKKCPLPSSLESKNPPAS